jgi:hypothetical protein
MFKCKGCGRNFNEESGKRHEVHCLIKNKDFGYKGKRKWWFKLTDTKDYNKIWGGIALNCKISFPRQLLDQLLTTISFITPRIVISQDNSPSLHGRPKLSEQLRVHLTVINDFRLNLALIQTMLLPTFVIRLVICEQSFQSLSKRIMEKFQGKLEIPMIQKRRRFLIVLESRERTVYQLILSLLCKIHSSVGMVRR